MLKTTKNNQLLKKTRIIYWQVVAGPDDLSDIQKYDIVPDTDYLNFIRKTIGEGLKE